MWSFPKIPNGRTRRLTALLWLAGWSPAGAATAGFRTSELPLAALGSPYHAIIETFVDGRCIDGGISFSTVDGALPRGLELRSNTISGVPEEFGAFPIRLRASNNCSAEERDFVVQVTGRPILRVMPEEVELEYRLGGPAPQAKVLLVSATWPQLAYTVTKGGEPWLRPRQQTGETPLAGSPFAGDVVRVEIVPAKLAPGNYEAQLVFSGPAGSTAVTVPVRLHVTP